MTHGDCVLVGKIQTLDPTRPMAESHSHPIYHGRYLEGPHEVAPHELRDVPVAMTIVGGEVAHSTF